MELNITGWGFNSHGMRKLSLITGAGLRDKLRWARGRLYSILILSPLVAGMTYMTVARVASYAPAGWRPSLASGLALAFVAEVCIVGLSLSRAVAELYHLRRPESVTDALPVAASTHFHAALLVRLARTCVLSLIVLVARSLFDENETTTRFASVDSDVLMPLLLFTLLTAGGEVLAALHWIHGRHARKFADAALALTSLLPVFASAALFLLLAAFPDMTAERTRARLALCGGILTAALYLLTRAAHARWRTRDIEAAKRLQATGTGRSLRARGLSENFSDGGPRIFRERGGPLRRASGDRMRRRASSEGLGRRASSGGLRRRLVEQLGGRSVAAQLARDLQLTRRAFSSAIYVSAGLAALCISLLGVAAWTRLLPHTHIFPPLAGDGGFFDATLLLPVVATKAACALSMAALVALTPVVVAYQLPHTWLERATGATGADVWRAKLIYTRLVSLPAPVLSWTAGLATGAVPLFYALPLLFECLWLWWMLSTLTGALSYEMPEQPGLALVLTTFICVGAGLFSAALWPVGLALYGLGIEQLRERGARMARQHLAAEAS